VQKGTAHESSHFDISGGRTREMEGGGDAVVQLAEALRYKPVGHGFDF